MTFLGADDLGWAPKVYLSMVVGGGCLVAMRKKVGGAA